MRSAVGLAPRLQDISPAEWLVAISRDEPGRSLLPGGAAGAVRAFVSGRLFDRSDLIRDTGAEPDASDAELVLAAYRAWGESAFGRLRGRYALAIIDETAGAAFLVRDPVGTHPLFYAEAGGSVVFGTTPDRLTRVPGVSSALNAAALADRLCWRWPERDETFFEAVRRVPPGCFAAITRGRFRVERYWDPAPAGRPVAWLPADEIDRFDSVLEQAVARACGPGRSGIFLSGGLDSISVAAVATDWTASHGRPRPLALSLGFPDPECDERLRQTAVARDLGLPQILVDFWDAVDSRGLLRSALALSATLGSPLLNTWGPAYQSLARRARTSGVDTILTGMGGDEWLTVTPLLSADLLSQGRFGAVAEYLRTMLRSHALGRAQIVRNVLWSYGLRPLASRTLYRLAPQAWDRRRAARRIAGDPSWVAPDPRLRAVLHSRAPRHLGPADPPDGFYLHELRASLDQSLVSWELEEQFEFGQQAGVAFAHPYWDADLVDTLLRTPPELLSRGGRSKSLVRESVARRFPAIGLDRQRKVSATTFHRAILDREGAAALASVGDFRTLDALGVVDGRRAQEVALQASADPRQRAQVWDLVNLETWARSHAV